MRATHPEAGAWSTPQRCEAAVSVVIVNFNAGPLLGDCVEAVLASTLPVQVLVSDNGSTDDSLARIRVRTAGDPRVLIAENGRNLGFARACNAVLGAARGEYLLFLNPDCLVRPGTLKRMHEVMEAHPDAGMGGCLVLNPDGSEQVGCRRQVPTPKRALMRAFGLAQWFRRRSPLFRDFLLQGEPLPDAPTEVEAISGAFMLVRRTALERVGPLDEGYFLHCEDLDWCMRFRQAGWRVLFVPDVVVTHHKGHCSQGRPIAVLWHMHRGMLRYYRKFFRGQYPAALTWLVTAGVWTRFSGLALREISRRLLARR